MFINLTIVLRPWYSNDFNFGYPLPEGGGYVFPHCTLRFFIWVLTHSKYDQCYWKCMHYILINIQTLLKIRKWSRKCMAAIGLLKIAPQWLNWLLSILRRWFCCCWFLIVDSLLIVTPIVGFCCSMFCSALLNVSILVLQSSWWGGESWLLGFVCLPGVSWLLCGSSSRCQGFVCSLWLWYFRIIHTYYFCWFHRRLYI